MGKPEGYRGMDQNRKKAAATLQPPLCRGGGTRTHDLCVPNAALYQLSHTPIVSFIVPLDRFELPTFSSGNYCSIH